MAAELKVLFVDDVSDTRDLIQFTLESQGFGVTTVQTAEECLRESRKGLYSLFLLDIGLPDKDGLELCREIRRFDQKTPILFYTAFAELLDLGEAQRAGAQGVVRKPEDTARLGEIIKKQLETHI